MIIIIPLSALLMCPLGVILFEALYSVQSARIGRFGKSALCCLWWLFIGLSFAFSGWVVFILSLPLYVLTGISHCNLAASHEGIITVVDVFHRIPETVRALRDRIRPYLK